MRLRIFRRTPRQIRVAAARLKRLDKGWATPEVDVEDAQRQLDELLDTVPPGPVDEALLLGFDRFVDSFVPRWKAQIRQAYEPVLTELELLEIKVAPHVERYQTLASDNQQKLASLDLAVTDALYRVADDDQPLQNPLRHDPLRANPPHSSPRDASPGA